MFFFLPLKINRKYETFPYLTILLITINTIIFFGTIGDLSVVAQKYGFTLGSGWWYTWLTSIFIHGSLSHLGFNMYFLWVFGSFLEDVIGRAKYLLLYLCGGLVSAFTHSLLTASIYPEMGKVPLIGASGAIAAVMGLFALRFLYYKIRIAYFFFIFYFIRWGVFELSSIVALLLWFGREFFFGALQLVGLNSEVAYWAHIGGFLFGLLWAKLANFEDEAKHEHYLEEARSMARKDWGVPALVKYESALKMDPSNVEIMAEMAPLLAETGQKERAVLFYRVAIEKMLKEGRREKAAELLIDAHEKLGGVDEISFTDNEKYSLACAVEAINNLSLAESFYRELSSNGNSHIKEMALFRLGKVLQKEGRREEAKEIFRKFLEEFPHSEWSSYVQRELELLEGVTSLPSEGNNFPY
jgi:membrane associated rhomboid family serine protease